MLPILPMLALASLAGFAGYQYSKAKQKNNTQTATNTNTTTTTNTEKTPLEKQNIYNYYTNDSINGNTLFNGQTEKKRNLFGNN